MTKGIASPLLPAPPAPPSENPFRYGWRYVKRKKPDGTTDLEQVPLTLEDVLHPREEDVIPENTVHQQERDYLANVLRFRLSGKVNVRVLSDCLINWGITGLGNHSPDVSVFFDVQHPDKKWGTFPVAKEGAKPILAVEIVSPDTRNNDVTHKLAEYYQAGVPLYVIVDQEKEDGPRRLLGFRRTPDGYVQLTPDAQGRLRLEPVGVLLGLRDNRLVCWDTETGAELGDYTQVSQALAKTQRREAEEAAARQAAEQREREQVAARQAAEQREREQVAARQAAEQREREQVAARQAAEQRAREAEAKMRELEAQLRRLPSQE